MPPKEQLKVKETAVYHVFLLMRDDILKNKWYLSEKMGYDVGFERALIDWMINHRERFIKSLDADLQEIQKRIEKTI